MSLIPGIRVVEMGLWVAGPAAGGILADWGAEVIKIEMLSGDPMRKLFGALSGSKEERCPPFDLYNRGKRSIALDINQPEGNALAQRIVASADVFVTNMRPQFLLRAGLDHAHLLAAHPKLVYASLTGYGLDGPDKDAPGFDVAAFAARAGVADRATAPGTAPPTWPGGMGDNVTAIATVAGILGALLSRERTGRGQLVSTSLLRTGIYSIGMDVSTRVGLGRITPTPSRTRLPNPLMNSYRAGDGKWFWLIGAEAERHWPGIVAALGVQELLDDERFATPRDRRRNAEALVTTLDQIFAAHTRDEWRTIFAQHDVWWAPVNSVDDLMGDPQVRAAGAFVEVPTDRSGEAPRIPGVATPVDFGAAKVGPAGPPPDIGQDTDAVLGELGINAQELGRLRSAAIIK